MSLVVKSAETASKGPNMAVGVKQPPTSAFMDGLTITAKVVIKGRWMLEDLEQWAKIKFKPARSRSLVLEKGTMTDKFKIMKEVISTVSEKPIKGIEKVFYSTLPDRQCINDLEDEARDLMEKLENSGLPGKFIAWCF
jgi:serine protease inhibitor